MINNQFISIGAGSVVSSQRLIAVVAPDSAPVRRMIQEARERGTLIDATCGKKTQAVLVMDSDHLILTSRPLERLQLLRDEDAHD